MMLGSRKGAQGHHFVLQALYWSRHTTYIGIWGFQTLLRARDCKARASAENFLCRLWHLPTSRSLGNKCDFECGCFGDLGSGNAVLGVLSSRMNTRP